MTDDAGADMLYAGRPIRGTGWRMSVIGYTQAGKGDDINGSGYGQHAPVNIS
jgi:hypothetical protein